VIPWAIANHYGEKFVWLEISKVSRHLKNYLRMLQEVKNVIWVIYFLYKNECRIFKPAEIPTRGLM
jgi:hypothetical protein